MIRNECSFYSKALGEPVKVLVLLPIGSGYAIRQSSSLDEVYAQKTYPVLYLFHCANGCAEDWLYRSDTEAYAEEAGIALAIPDLHDSFGVDMAHGKKYGTFLSEELPRFLHHVFPISEARAETAAAGCSMGGYTAAYHGLIHPERFSLIGVLSGALQGDVIHAWLTENGIADDLNWKNIFGEARTQHEDTDVFQKIDPDAEYKPEFLVFCGEEETCNVEMNQRFHKKLKEAGYEASFAGGHGEHGWRYWDGCIHQVIERFAERIREDEED